jgi:hypothetical protein
MATFLPTNLAVAVAWTKSSGDDPEESGLISTLNVRSSPSSGGATAEEPTRLRLKTAADGFWERPRSLRRSMR